MVVNVLIICMSVLVNIVGEATWAHKQIVPHISHIVPHHQCGSHCTDKFVPHDQHGSHYTNKPHLEESHCPTAQRRHCRWKKCKYRSPNYCRRQRRSWANDWRGDDWISYSWGRNRCTKFCYNRNLKSKRRQNVTLCYVHSIVDHN